MLIIRLLLEIINRIHLYIFSHHEGDLLVAKVLPTKQVAYVCKDGQEIPKYQFEVSNDFIKNSKPLNESRIYQISRSSW